MNTINKSKNKLLLLFSSALSITAFIIFFLHRKFDFLQQQVVLVNGQGTSINSTMITTLLLALLILLNIISWIMYLKNHEDKKSPWLITFTLLFSSVLIIASGEGLVEYHFSIFVVMAIITMFHQQSLIFTGAIFFSLYHFLGFFFFPELLCGTADYSFSLLMIHTFFLILSTISGALITKSLQNADEKNEKIQAENDSKISSLLAEIQAISKNVQSSSKDLANETTEVFETSKIIQNAINDTKNTIDQTSTLVSETSDNGLQLEKQIVDIQVITNEIASFAIKASHIAQNGSSSIQTIENHNNSMEDSLNDLSNLVEQLHDYSKEISTRVIEIEQISDQTKLLALNASIEAARAGEHGKGFNVVANEVQKLAVNSKNSTMQIMQLISSMYIKVEDIQKTMTASVEEVSKGRKIVDHTKQTFAQIVDNSKNMEFETTSISKIIDSVVNTVKEVNETFQSVLSSNANLLGKSEESLVSSNNQIESMTDLDIVSKQLNHVVDQLNLITNSQTFTNLKKDNNINTL